MFLSHKETKNQRDIPNDQLEFVHIIPKYMNGSSDDSNTNALRRPEHAFQHQLIAESQQVWSDAHKNYSAVSLIVSRMTPQEKIEFDTLLQEHNQDDIQRRKNHRG